MKNKNISEMIAKIDNQFYLPADTFFPSVIPDALTYGDISLKTCKSSILPKDADPSIQLSETIHLATPILSSDMDTVTESKMAIAMALNGGLGILHSNLSPEQQIKEVQIVKHSIHGTIKNPVTVSPESSIHDILNMIQEKNYKFHTFPVVDKNKKLIGLLGDNVIKERYSGKQVSEVMKKEDEIQTINEKKLGKNPIMTAHKFFNENIGKHKLLIIDDNNTLKGLITASDVDRIMKESTNNIKLSRDSEHRLMVGATLHMFRDIHGKLDRDKILAHVAALVAEGIDIVAISTAHGHTESVGEMVSLVRHAYPNLTIMAGNVTSAQGVEFLSNAGANVIKIGQGPGSICTTRVMTGVGIPQMTALYVCAKAAEILGVKIVADGGINVPGDMVKALTLSHAVMCGSILAACPEAPGEIFEIEGKKYKSYRGMGSIEAMKAGSASRYGQNKVDTSRKLAAEGISAMKETSGPVSDVLSQFRSSIQSGMGYLGANNLENLRGNARYVRMSGAGQKESGVHDVVEVKKK